jgi:hypothetical protein
LVPLLNDRRYAGCRSWVDLLDEVSIAGSKPAIEEDSFELQRQAILSFARQAEGNG